MVVAVYRRNSCGSDTAYGVVGNYIGINEMNFSNLHLADYIVIGIYLGATLALGVWFHGRQKNTRDYFFGGGMLRWWAIAISLFATVFSAISFVAMPGEAYNFGLTMFLGLPISVLALPVGLYIFLRFFYELGIQTCNEYLELRFSPVIRLISSLSFLVLRGVYIGVVLYASALVLRTVVGWPAVISILLVGIFSLVFAYSGGMASVVWTDVAQFFVLLGGLLLLIGVIAMAVPGGLAGIWEIAAANGRTFNVSAESGFWGFDPNTRIVIWYWLIGLPLATFGYATDQIQLQRALSCRNFFDITRTIWGYAIGGLPVFFLFYFAGLAVFAYFKTVGAEVLPVGADGVVVTVSVGAGSVNVVDKHAVQAIFTSHSANYVFENGESTYTLTAYLTVTAHSVQVVWEIPEFTYNGKVQHNADDPGIRAYYTDIDGEKVYLIVGNSADGEFRDWREGGYRFTVYGDDANYALSNTQATVMMNKAAITVIVEDKQSVYGEEDAVLTYLSDGETFGQNISVVLSREAGSDVGEYTIGADISGADNFEVTVIEGTYTIIKAQIDPSVSLEGWVFGEAAGEPVVIGAAEGTVTYLYTGMTNGGKQWNSMSAPTEAGSYTLTVTIAETANTFGGTASVHFTVARAQLAVPTLGDSGENKLTAVYEDEIAVLPITGFDPFTMGVYGVAVSIDGSNVSIVAASAGERTAHVYLKDANNYEWVSGSTDEVLLIWTLEESTDSLSWLIIVLGSLFAVEIILFIIALMRRNRRGGTPASEGTSADGTSDGVSAGKEGVAAEESAGESGDGSTQSNAFAFAPLMMLSVPIGQIGAIIGLGIACVALAVADVVLFVRKKKHAEQ